MYTANNRNYDSCSQERERDNKMAGCQKRHLPITLATFSVQLLSQTLREIDVNIEYYTNTRKQKLH